MSTELEGTHTPKANVAKTTVSAVEDDGTEEGRQVEKYTIHHEEDGDVFVFPQKVGRARVVRDVSAEEIEEKKFEPQKLKLVKDLKK